MTFLNPLLLLGVLASMGTRRAGVLIALDASCSMQHSDGTATRFERALRKVDLIAQSIRPGDPVSLVLLGAEHRVVARNMVFDPDTFSDVLADQRATFELLDLDSVPRTLEELSAELQAPQREDTTARYRATVRNYGEQPVQNVRVNGLKSNISVDGKVIPGIAPGASASVSLFVPFRDAGAARIMAALEDDALVADHSRRTVAVIRDKVSVLCVDGDSAGGVASRLITAALQAYRSLDSEEDLVVQSVSWTDLPAQDLKRFDVVILADVPDITGEQADAFERDVRDGRGLIWFAGARDTDMVEGALRYLEGRMMQGRHWACRMC